MKICFDAFALNHLKNTGLYTYSYEVINSLFKIYPQPNYNLITNSKDLKFPFKDKSGVMIDYIDINRKENDYSKITKYLKDNKINLYHSLNNGFSIPKEKTCKYVLTIHDMLPFSNSKLVDDKYLKKFKEIVPDSLEKADKVIAVSDFIKDELVDYCNFKKDKIEVIYPEISKEFRPIPKNQCKEFLMKHYNIYDDFLLYVGSIHERKNLPLLFSSFKEVVKIEKNIKLLIIGAIKGKREEYYLKLKKYAKALGIEDKVNFIGSINYNHMPYFYNASKCFLNFSIYDGFPLTSLEARRCNIPIITSKLSSFEEVLGNYPIYINTIDPKEISSKILELIYRNSDMLNVKESIENISIEPEQINKLIRVYESILYT